MILGLSIPSTEVTFPTDYVEARGAVRLFSSQHF